MKPHIFRSGAIIAGALSLVNCFPSLPPEDDVSVEDVVATDDSTPANDATEDVDGPFGRAVGNDVL